MGGAISQFVGRGGLYKRPSATKELRAYAGTNNHMLPHQDCNMPFEQIEILITV